MKRHVSLILFLAFVLGGGFGLGFLTAPGEWYAGLTKPSFNPPAWLFGPVWTVLYVLIAVAGWRVWQCDRRSWPMKLWWAQLALNFLWTPIFFGAHQIGLALVLIPLMLAAVLGFIATVWRLDRVAAWLFVPYAAWAAFASLLNGSIFMLNYGGGQGWSNVPFSVITPTFESTSTALPSLEWNKRGIVWLDYDDPLSPDVLADVRRSVGAFPPGV